MQPLRLDGVIATSIDDYPRWLYHHTRCVTADHIMYKSKSTRVSFYISKEITPSGPPVRSKYTDRVYLGGLEFFLGFGP